MANLGDDLLEAMDRITTLDARLRGDTERCHQEIAKLTAAKKSGRVLDRKEAEFWMRTFLKLFFAQVEGLSFAMREAVVFLSRQGHLRLADGTLAVLEEKGYRSRNGKVQAFDSFNPTLENFLLAFQYFPAAFGTEYAVAKGDARWEAFKNSLALRHRLMHPKRPEDLDLSGDLMLEFADAFKWFAEQVAGCFGAILARLEKMSSETT